jgi:hypothetical protein
MPQRLAAVRLIACRAIDAAQEYRGDSYSRSLAATPNCLAHDWIDRTALAACWFDISITKTSLPAGLASSATSLKQAVLAHLRES